MTRRSRSRTSSERSSTFSTVIVALVTIIVTMAMGPATPSAASTIYAGTQHRPGPSTHGHVLRLGAGMAWEDISPFPDIGVVWDLELFEGQVWACGDRSDGMPFVARWDGSSWTTWGWPTFVGPVTSLAVVGGHLYAIDYLQGLHVHDGAGWSPTIVSFPEAARLVGDGCGAAEPVVLMGSDRDDSLAAYDPAGAMPCGASCPVATGGCGAGCFGGSCIHSMALHDDGTGLVAYAGAYAGLMYRWSPASHAFVPTTPIPGAGSVQGLASYAGRLHAGTSDGTLWGRAVAAWTQVIPGSGRPPISTLETDSEGGLLWIGRGGVPFSSAVSTGISLIETWDGATLTAMGGLNSFDGGVVALLATPTPEPSICDAGASQVIECAGALTAVQLQGSGSSPSAACNGTRTPRLNWTGSFVEGMASGMSPIVHFSSLGDHEVTLRPDDAAAPTCTTTITLVDTQAPTMGALPDRRVTCDALPARRELPTVHDICDDAPYLGFTESRVDGACPFSYTILRTWIAVDAAGNRDATTQRIEITDDQPPVVVAGALDLHFIWPPNHRMVPFTKDDFLVSASDSCDGLVTWRLAGCASDQPDNDLGDGNTEADCIVAPDGSSFAVRAERQGGAPEGRRYAVTVIATDACGNESSPTLIGFVHVRRDER